MDRTAFELKSSLRALADVGARQLAEDYDSEEVQAGGSVNMFHNI